MKKFLLLIVALVATCASAWADDVYVVAGTSNLCGSSWNGSDTTNVMTLQDDGTYVKTFTNVAVADGYQLKVVKNGSTWYGDATGNNVTFNVTTACDVNVYFNPSNSEITVSGTGVAKSTLEINKVIAVGNGSGNWLNGISWDQTSDTNKMTEVADKVYEISFADVPVGDSYQVKFALNGAWTDNFGGTYPGNGVEGDATYNGSNIYVSVEKAGTVTLRLDLSKFDYDTKTGAKMTITSPEAEEPTDTTYYLKHPWGGGDAWSWKPMEVNTNKALALTDDDGSVYEWGYILVDVYGGTGVNVNTKASDSGSTWIASPNLLFNPVVGDTCIFDYFPNAGFLMILPKTWANINIGFDPEPGTYKGPLTVHVTYTNIPEKVTSIQYSTDDGDTYKEYNDQTGIVLTESADIVVILTTESGQQLHTSGEYTISEVTGINDVNTNATSKVVKMLENGQVVIVKDGIRYNIMGAQMK